MVSFETVIAGTEKKNTVLTDTEKRLVAYHEVGHALVSVIVKENTPIAKITIVPHTSGAVGYTMYTPDEEKYLSTKEEMLAKLCSLMGGRAAEEVAFATKTNGAYGDIQQATTLARKMVSMYGMSDELGLMATAAVQNAYLDGQAYMDCAQDTAYKVDMAVQKLLQDAHAKAKHILTDHRALMDEIAQFLLLKETITGEQLMDFVNAAQKEQDAPAPEENAE